MVLNLGKTPFLHKMYTDMLFSYVFYFLQM